MYDRPARLNDRNRVQGRKSELVDTLRYDTTLIYLLISSKISHRSIPCFFAFEYHHSREFEILSSKKNINEPRDVERSMKDSIFLKSIEIFFGNKILFGNIYVMNKLF